MSLGFNQDALREGWNRLENVTRVRLVDLTAKQDPKAVETLDNFENLWFAVSRATLQHHYLSDPGQRYKRR